MIRRFNYTQRKRIEKQRVSIELHEPDDGGVATFSATLNLADLQLPDDARLDIAAIGGRGAMRFAWGTVGHPQPSPDCRLTRMSANPSFRIIAQDADNKILALANNITPKRAAGRESLLWLQEDDLGQEVWRMDFSSGAPGRPVLQVNSAISGISAAMRQDDAMRGLVLPAALRAILTKALIVDDVDPTDSDGDWSDWFGFVGRFYFTDYPGENSDEQRDKSAVIAWIEGAVDAFTQQRFPASELYAKARA